MIRVAEKMIEYWRVLWFRETVGGILWKIPKCMRVSEEHNDCQKSTAEIVEVIQ